MTPREPYGQVGPFQNRERERPAWVRSRPDCPSFSMLPHKQSGRLRTQRAECYRSRFGNGFD